jgi:hypothetical protein
LRSRKLHVVSFRPSKIFRSQALLATDFAFRKGGCTGFVASATRETFQDKYIGNRFAVKHRAFLFNNPRLETREFHWRQPEVYFIFSVIPAEAGIQAAL